MTTITNIKAEKLSKLVTDGITSWVEAGEIIVEMLDQDGMSLSEINEITLIPKNLLSRFEQMGRKQLLPDLLIHDYPATKYLYKLPYSEQKRLMKESVELLLVEEGDIMNVSIPNLTTKQCKQVFSKNEVRDLPAQRAYIESTKTDEIIKHIEVETPYKICKGKVVFSKNATMTTNQIASLLSQLTSK